MFKLALALGKTVAELEQTLSDRELEEWLTFHRHVSPLPDPYWIGGQICAVTASTWGGSARTEDFIPRCSKPKSHRLSAEESAAALRKEMPSDPKGSNQKNGGPRHSDGNPGD